MSDDILKRDVDLCMGRLVDLGERFKNLEKKVESPFYLELIEFKRKIEELEKKMGVFDKIDIIQTQIEEIKEQFTKWVGEFGNETLKYKEEIAELKEEMKIFKGAVINYNHDYDRIRQVREVLRELIETVNLRGEISQTSADKLLAKLSDSGGEKEVRARHSEFDERNVPSDDLSTHSKPPEYSLTQEDIDRLVKPFEEPREDDLPEIYTTSHREEIKELILEFVNDLNELGNNEHWIVPPLSNLIEKWEGRLK